MIDIHCHILPGMDDGPDSLHEAIEMCRHAAADGVKVIVATPHFRTGTYEWTETAVTEAVSALEAAIGKEGIDLRVLPGAEVSIFPELSSSLKKGHLFTINRGGIYILIEFQPHSIPDNWETFLLSLIEFGLIPIIAHPERIPWFINHPKALFSIVRSGVMLQITAASITGGWGSQARDFSTYLLRHDLAHVIASDAHSADLRPAVLSEAVSFAAAVIGHERAMAMVTSVPAAIISGRRIALPEPLLHVLSERGIAGKWLKRLFRHEALDV